MPSEYQRFVSAAMRAVRPRSLAEGRRTLRVIAAEWRRRRRNPARKKKRRPGAGWSPLLGGTWQPDLFGGAGIERREGATRAEQLEMARQEMRDTGSRDLFDLLPKRNPAARARAKNALEHGESLATARRAADSPESAVGRTRPPCPACGAPVRLGNPTHAPTVTCSRCGQTSQVKRP